MPSADVPVGHVPPDEGRRLGDLLRGETTGGFLLILAATAAVVIANSPLSAAYFELRDLRIGPEALHLDLTVGTWASDGLLAVFFFLIALELKRELVAGQLRRIQLAVVPVAGAVGGVILPAVLYLVVTWGDPVAAAGWPIPTATDIAFALAVLALVGRSLPLAARLFLLTLAVVDDLIAIGIIALVYTADLDVVPLLAAVPLIAIYAALVQFRPALFEGGMRTAWLVLFPIAALVWILVHDSGIHATIAGVLLGFTVPVKYSARDRGRHHRHAPGGLGAHLEHELRPISSGVAVPIFAFFAAGVVIGGIEGILQAVSDPVVIGILVGLVVGKPIGILATTWIVTTLTRAELDPSLRWADLAVVSAVAGIGFTVSLLVAVLTFGEGSPHGDDATIAILAASVGAALVGTVVARLGARSTPSASTKR